MKGQKLLGLTLCFLMIAGLPLSLSSCKSGMKFESAADMKKEMIGTYAAQGEFEGEYIVVTDSELIRFHTDNIFHSMTDRSFFDEHFAGEKWEKFTLDTLLEKSFIDISRKTLITDVDESLLCGLWIAKDGTIYSDKKDGYPFKKMSDVSYFPTKKMEKQFENYSEQLQKYEVELIVDDGKGEFSKREKELESTISSARSTSQGFKCSASAETIASSAFEAMKSAFKYPLTAKLEGYSTAPKKDSYGRVMTLITVTSQNGHGNYITESYYVILQSCSYTGECTFLSYSYYCKENSGNALINMFMSTNDWDNIPNYDENKEQPYAKGLDYAEKGEYLYAISELEDLNGYRKSEDVITACNNCNIAKDYEKVIELFDSEKYSETLNAVSSLLKSNNINDEYSKKILRIKYLCKYFEDKENAETNEKETTANTEKN